MDQSYFFKSQLTPQQVALFYLGQEGFLFKYREHYYLIDPYLSDYVDKNCCTEFVKWTRNYAPPIHPELLDFVDYVLCTHDHYDHADPETLHAISRYNTKAKFIVPEPIKNTFLSYGISSNRIIGAIAGEKLSLGNCEVLPVPAAHEELHPDEQGNYKELGYKLTFGQLSVFHAGDCCIYEGLSHYIKNTDVLMVPINGRSYYKLQNNIIGNMTAEEAILLAREIQTRLLIPMHYDLYDINGLNPAQFVDCLYQTNPKQAFHIFSVGEEYIINP